jgi:hypothetical protein
MNRLQRRIADALLARFPVVLSAILVVAISGCAASIAAERAPATTSVGAFPSAGRSDGMLPKQDRLRIEQARRSTAALSPSPKDPEFSPPFVAPPVRASGVLVNDQAPLPAAGFASQDEWSGPSEVPGKWLYVYAGNAWGGSTDVPAVVVWTVPTDPNTVDLGPSGVVMYRAPALSGYLHIVSGSDRRLNLTSTPTDAPGVPKFGTTIVATFDVDSDTFTRS